MDFEYRFIAEGDKDILSKALIAVDIYGQPLDYDTVIDICNKNNVIVIEDAAESLGSEYKDSKWCFWTNGRLSFNENKIITTSGGGMLVSDDKEKIKKARFLSTQARKKHSITNI